MKRYFSWFLVCVLFAYASASAGGDTITMKSNAITHSNGTSRRSGIASNLRVARELPSSEEKKLYIDIHNFYRRKAGASNMREVVSITHTNICFVYFHNHIPYIKVLLQKWDKSLAEMALVWAKGCSWKHGQPENVSPYEKLGQNLYCSTEPELNIYDAITLWYDEIIDYNFEDDTCAPAMMCGHYTQVMWDDTDVIGCAHFTCDRMTDINPPLQDAVYVVCNYGPP